MARGFSLRVVVAIFVFLSVGPATFALYLHDTTVVIPIVGRFPGGAGTQWRTDVFVANPSSVAKSVQMTLYVAGGSPISHTFALSPFSTESFPDIVLNTFGLTTAAGELQLKSSNESGIEARARIFNAGHPAGEFGQNVPGIGLTLLRRQAYVYGLSGISGSRVNIGVTNPNATAVAVTLYISNKTHGVLRSESFTLAPHQNAQFTDMFSRFGIPPQSDVQVSFNTVELPIYGYASEVRNDTGDAIFVLGTSPNQ